MSLKEIAVIQQNLPVIIEMLEEVQETLWLAPITVTHFLLARPQHCQAPAIDRQETQKRGQMNG